MQQNETHFEQRRLAGAHAEAHAERLRGRERFVRLVRQLRERRRVRMRARRVLAELVEVRQARIQALERPSEKLLQSHCRRARATNGRRRRCARSRFRARRRRTRGRRLRFGGTRQVDGVHELRERRVLGAQTLHRLNRALIAVGVCDENGHIVHLHEA